MKVRDMMTKNVPYCFASDRAPQAEKILIDMGAGGIVPIVDSSLRGKLIGVVTDRDLWLEVERRDSRSVRVSDCMTAPVIRCAPEDDVERAVDCMLDHEVLRIPVVDQDHRIQGMVSMIDVLRCTEDSPAKAYEALMKR